MTYKTENKPDYTLLNRDNLDGPVKGLEYGAKKHGRDNYLTNPAVTDRELVAATLRHALAAADNPDAIDEESGLFHTDLAACNVLMLARRRAKRTRVAAPTPPPPTNEARPFAVGDRVRCVDAQNAEHYLTEGRAYTVRETYPSEPRIRIYDDEEELNWVTSTRFVLADT